MSYNFELKKQKHSVWHEMVLKHCINCFPDIFQTKLYNLHFPLFLASL